MQYITLENLQKWTHSLISQGTSHLKKAMKDMSNEEQDEFVSKLVQWNVKIEEMESIKDILSTVDWSEETNDSGWDALNQISHILYPNE